jgi:hypothetical protein
MAGMARKPFLTQRPVVLLQRKPDRLVRKFNICEIRQCGIGAAMLVVTVLAGKRNVEGPVQAA